MVQKISCNVLMTATVHNFSAIIYIYIKGHIYPAPLLASASAEGGRTRSTTRTEMERTAKVQKGEEDILEVLCCPLRAPRVTEEQEDKRIPVQKVPKNEGKKLTRFPIDAKREKFLSFFPGSSNMCK